jgi:hypothetical protein
MEATGELGCARGARASAGELGREEREWVEAMKELA